VFPVLVVSILPVVAAEPVVHLACLCVLHLLEVGGLVGSTFLLELAAGGSLLLFEAGLLGNGEIDLAFFEGALVGAEAAIGWGDCVFYFIGEVVEIYREVGVVVLVFSHLWEVLSFPDLDGLASFFIISTHLFRPLAANDPVLGGARAHWYLALDDGPVLLGPPHLLELEFELHSVLFWDGLVALDDLRYFEGAIMFNIEVAEDQIVNCRVRLLCRVLLLEPPQLHMVEREMDHFQGGAPELSLHLRVHEVLPVHIASLSKASGHRRMVRNLLSNKLKVGAF